MIKDVLTLIALAAAVILMVVFFSIIATVGLVMFCVFVGWFLLWQLVGVPISFKKDGKVIGHLRRFKYHSAK